MYFFILIIHIVIFFIIYNFAALIITPLSLLAFKAAENVEDNKMKSFMKLSQFIIYFTSDLIAYFSFALLVILIPYLFNCNYYYDYFLYPALLGFYNAFYRIITRNDFISILTVTLSFIVVNYFVLYQF